MILALKLVSMVVVIGWMVFDRAAVREQRR